MRAITLLVAIAIIGSSARAASNLPAPQLFVDVHELGAGNVTAEAVAEAHLADLAVQGEFDTSFLKYWVDEASGRVFCLSKAPSAEAIVETHRAAHGLLPDSVFPVSEGQEAPARGDCKLFLDVHRLGPGAVTADAVAEAHLLDLEKQGEFGVNFLDYWLDEGEGMIWCLSEAASADAVNQTHAAAHGLVPDDVMEVTQGQ